MDKAFGKMTVTGTSAEDAEGTTVLSNKVFTAGPDKWVVKLNWSNYLFFFFLRSGLHPANMFTGPLFGGEGRLY